jgi:uncharacterized membrane protein
MIYRRKARKVVLFLTLGVAAAALLGFLVMSLWNWLAPAVFAGRTITYWQALGILLLSRILFGGFFRRHGGRGRPRFVDGWEQLTPEEREKFRQGLRQAEERRTARDSQRREKLEKFFAPECDPRSGDVQDM